MLVVLLFFRQRFDSRSARWASPARCGRGWLLPFVLILLSLFSLFSHSPAPRTNHFSAGATFASGELAQVEAEEAEMAEMPACTIAFVPKAESSTRVAGTLTVPLYVTAAREQILARLKMPSIANKKYIIAGAALILGSS